MMNMMISLYMNIINMRNNPNSERQRRHSSQHYPPSQCTQTHFYLTQRGVNQAQRNKSDEIWWALGSSPDGYALCYYNGNQQVSNRGLLELSDIGQRSGGKVKQIKEIFKIEKPNKQKQSNIKDNDGVRSRDNSTQEKSARPKNVSFSLSQQQQKQKQTELKSNIKIVGLNNEDVQKIPLTSLITKNMTKEEAEQYHKRRHKFLQQCYSIDKYLKSNKAYTRQMPNSAIKLFYERPCLQPYGRGNTKGNNGFIYNDFMKTHNVLPHRLGNQPVKYQAYRSSLNFCKRAKIDPEERWRKIHRQMAKKFNMNQLVQHFAQGVIDVNQENLEETLKLNINSLKGTKFQRSKSLQNLQTVPASIHFPVPALSITQKSDKMDLNTTKATSDFKETSSSDRILQMKRSKSWGKKQHLFIYKYTDKEGDTQYCKDRHGISCYVDPTFKQNQDAYAKFLKRIKPIYAQDVKPEDRNIDQIMVQNFVISKQEDVPRHYLLPNCDQPQKYQAAKYSVKARRKSMLQSTSAAQVKVQS